MNDVLPKPFTKEGLLQMLEKHLVNMKKGHNPMDPLGQGQAPAVQNVLASGRQSLKEEDSPQKSPATTSNWNSPNQVPGVSPVGSSHTDEYVGLVHPHPAVYGMPAMAANGMGYAPQPSPLAPPPLAQMQMQQAARQAQAGHRRQLSDISGGDDSQNAAKRQQTYMPSMQDMSQLSRPR
jgi:osomolarity two-component system response regulator SKN7